MVSKKITMIMCFICICLGASISLFKKPEIKEVIKIQVVESKEKDIQKDSTKTTKKTQLPDGTIITETVIENKDKIKIKEDKKVLSEKSLNVKIENKHRIQLFQSISKDQNGILNNTGISYTYKIFSPLYLNTELYKNGDYSIRAGIELEF